MSNRQALDPVLEQLKQYLPQYLTSQGIDVRKLFLCINPEHHDHTPSCGLLKHNPARGWCFSCQTTFDIFDAVIWLEGKPAAGRGWLTDTVMYLAERFGVEIPTLDLSDKDLRELQIVSAYQHALSIIRGDGKSDSLTRLTQKVQDKIAQYHWSSDVLYKLGIGSVVSYDDYMNRMRKYGHNDAFLHSVDLDNKAIFNNNALIFSIRDVDGTCVGFSSRDLNYETRKADHAEAVARGESPKFKPRKFFHTANCGSVIGGEVKQTLFDKSQVLMGLDLAKTTIGAIHVFEGNADYVTAFAGGLQNAVAILGTAFTKDHLDLLIKLGKKHIAIVLDSDQAGKKGTERIMTLVEDCSGLVGLRVEVIVIPGSKDPDAFIRTFASLEEGVREFRKLPVTDMFTWRLQRVLEDGEDPYVVCENTLPFIVNEPSNLVRMRMTKRLAQATGLNAEFIERDVLRLIDAATMCQDEEKMLVAGDVSKALRQDPKNAPLIMATGMQRLESLDRRNVPFNLESILKTIDLIFDEKERNNTPFELRTGFQQFDRVFGGIPRRGALFCLPGKPHHGKSIFLDNVVSGLLANNPDVMVVLHTIDDNVNMRIDRILGARTGMPSEVFRRPGFFLEDEDGKRQAPPYFRERYYEAKAWYKTMHEECRLLVADPAMLAADVMALRTWITELKRRYSDRTMVIIGDNFHLYDMVTDETGEGKIRGISRFINDQIVNGLGTTVMMTMEIPKEQLKPGLRPTYLNLKGSAGLSFDAKANIGIYSQLQDFSQSPDRPPALFWQSADHLEKHVNDDGIESMMQRKLPIVEAIVDKNKISGQKKTVFFRLEDQSGQMTECSPQEQSTLASQLVQNEATQATAELARSKAPYRVRL